MKGGVQLVRFVSPLHRARVTALLALMAALWHGLPAWGATTWYVCSGITGLDAGGIAGADAPFFLGASDLNAGTDPAHPLLTLGASGLQGRMADGDTAYISGRFYIPDSTPVAFHKPISCNGCTFAQWPGMPPAMIRGSNKAGVSGWTPTGVAAFTKNIGSGLGATLATVVFDYDSVQNIGSLDDNPGAYPSLGRRMSHLTPTAEADVLAAPADGTSGKYCYNNASGFLTVVLQRGTSPNAATSNGIEYSVRGRLGFYLTADSDSDRANSSNTFRGLRFALWADGASGSPKGTPIVISSGDRTTIADCIFEDSGIHSYSFGQRCTLNTCTNNTHIGMAPVGIACVFNATGSTNGDPNTSWGCRITNEAVYANSFLAHDGSLANRGSAVGGFICHGGVADIELENFRVVEYTPPDGGPPDRCVHFTVADAPPPGNRFDPGTYPVRVRQTDPALITIANGTTWPNQGMTSSAAYVNCVFRFPQLETYPSTSMIDLRSYVGTTGFFGCEFTAKLGNPAVSVAMFTIGADSSIVTVNCSGYDTSLTHGPRQYSIYRYDGLGGRVYDTQSVWGFRSVTTGTRHACIGDAAIGADHHSICDTAFWNVGADTFSENAGFHSSELWSAVIDAAAGGVTLDLVENPFLDPTGQGGLAPAWGFKQLVKFVVPHVEQGVNGYRYDGRYGAYQYDELPCPADADGSGFVNGVDFDGFVLDFYEGNPAADIDHSGFVNGVDFDTFMDHFVAGC